MVNRWKESTVHRVLLTGGHVQKVTGVIGNQMKSLLHVVQVCICKILYFMFSVEHRISMVLYIYIYLYIEKLVFMTLDSTIHLKIQTLCFDRLVLCC